MNKEIIIDKVAPETQQETKNGSLDFELTCIWRNQLKFNFYTKDKKEYAEVPMQSGKTALYEMTSERFNYVFEDTGQKNFYFKFIKYI